MKAVLAVAHPDDCVIFGWPIVKAHPEWDWKIVYLTYTRDDPRGREAARFWDKQNIPTVFLGFEDHYRDLEQGYISTFDTKLASGILKNNLVNTDVIVTHNADGDYGHIHHKFVNNVADEMDAPKIYFAGHENNNLEIKDQPTFDISQWPLHEDVIVGFEDRAIGRYYVSEEACRYI